MAPTSGRHALRELLNSRSAAASVVRVCVLVVLAQSALLVVRAPFARPAGGRLVTIDRDDTVRWRNGSLVNAKALASLLADLVEALGARAERELSVLAAADRLDTQEGADLLKRLSDDQQWAVRRTLAAILPEAPVVGETTEPSDRPGAGAAPLPHRYRADLHKIVLFDQWLPAADLTVWVSPLGDSAEDVLNYRLKMAVMSVCVSHRGQPHLAVLLYPFRRWLSWGLYARGNDLSLRVADPMRAYPERFGVTVDRRTDNASRVLAHRAFSADADVFEVGGAGHQLMATLGGATDASLFTGAVPRRALCAGHALLRLFGGRVTDLAGREIDYPAGGGAADGGTLAALFYHGRMLQQVVEARADLQVGLDA